MWLLAYGLLCVALLLPIGTQGIRNPLALTPWLVAGGLLESLPAIPLALTAVLALALALHLWQRKQGCKIWVLYSGLCLFLVGEEASWGKERILGWQARAASETETWDLHNWLLDGLEVSIIRLGWDRLFWASLLGLALIVVMGTSLRLIVQKRKRKIITLHEDRWHQAPRLFFGLGFVCIIGGSYLDALYAIGLPYFWGQWPIEEFLELLGSIAFLFVILAKIHAQWQNHIVEIK